MGLKMAWVTGLSWFQAMDSPPLRSWPKDLWRSGLWLATLWKTGRKQEHRWSSQASAGLRSQRSGHSHRQRLRVVQWQTVWSQQGCSWIVGSCRRRNRRSTSLRAKPRWNWACRGCHRTRLPQRPQGWWARLSKPRLPESPELLKH
jgi:hypothetical protein